MSTRVLSSPALPSLGAELEMVVIDEATGASACVGPGYFTSLEAIRRPHGDTRLERIGDTTVALHSDIGVNGIDNGFNLLETAHAPVPAGQNGLAQLAQAMQRDLSDVVRALATQGLALTSLAQHPTAGTGPEQYARAVAPKSIYRYLTTLRGWSHAAGIDAKAQNGPTTGLSADNAIPALNLLLATSPAFIALFANSPFESGRPSGLMETRMTLWPRMVATSRVRADRERTGLPPRWFTSLDDYFAWTFAPGTVMHAIPPDQGSYKGGAAFFVAGDGTMNAGDFFRGGPVSGQAVGNGERAILTPSAAHFEFLQWSNFLDFRLRFAFGQPGPTAAELAGALGPGGGFDALFRDHATNLYLENRCSGATFPDADLSGTADAPVLQSCMIAASALQAGLVAATISDGGDDGAAFLRRWPLKTIHGLREQAIRLPLCAPENRLLMALCTETLELARRHLPEADQPCLAYADWVLATGRTGAQRALDHWNRLGKPPLDELARARRVQG